MKLRTTVGALVEAFLITSPTLDRKGSASNLYLQANETSGSLYLYSTNLVAETATKIKAEIEVAGEVLVNPGKLSDGLMGLAKDIPVSLELATGGGSLKVTAGTVKFSLAASSAAKEIGDRMRLIPSRQAPAAIIPVAELTEFTKRSVFCIPNDQSGQKASLAALKLSDSISGEEAYATDGSIAVHISSTTKQGKGDGLGAAGLLIPSAALQPLASLVTKKKGEKVSIILTEKKNKVFFKFADGTFFGALLMNTTYPNLKSIIDQKLNYSFQVSREGLKQTLTRASSFVSSVASKRILEIELGPELLRIKANGDDILSDQVSITYTGAKPETAVRMGMNIDHLSNIASGSHSENLTFGFTAEDKPLMVTDTFGEDEETINTTYVVMGVKLAASAK